MMNRNILNPMMWTTGSWPTPPTPTDPWIYWSPSLWLISLSSDWNTWTTISDKNIWATQVYNSWDTLSTANCWYYFQRWNNYPYPWTWSVSVSSTKANAKNFGPYYESNIFISWNTDWALEYNWNLRANSTTKQGPAPDWYHVPSKDDFSSMMTILKNIKPIAVWVIAEYIRWLKIPLAWYLYYNNPNQVTDQWERAILWSTTIDASVSTQYLNRSYSLALSNTSYSVWTGSRANWCSVRCFRNEPIAPDNTWTTIYEDWNKWVYRNAWLELITITDWNNMISMQDKNLWAVAVYSNWDTLSEANCWYYFQRWNNYGFPGIWYTDTIQTSPTQVDATNYWPYYEWQVFRIQNSDWTNPANPNLWWWIANTTKARRWPCPKWFHVPSTEDHIWLIDTLSALWINTNNWICLNTYLKMPFAGFRDYRSGSTSNQDSTAHYWSSTPRTDSDSAYILTFASYNLYPQSSAYRAYGFNVRPFKNESVTPDSTRTKLY